MNRIVNGTRRVLLAVGLALGLAGAAHSQGAAATPPAFTIAVVPDTQFYLDYTHQTEAGFKFDARNLFFEQMEFLAARTRSQGGDIAFVTAVGDVWEHQTKRMDEDHYARGLRSIPNPGLDVYLAPSDKAFSVEMPIAREGYAMIAGKVPFSVVPGNHDYDAQWTDSRYPISPDPMKAADKLRPYGMLHFGGLDNWRQVFGEGAPFFEGRPWYVAAYNGGADSAQVFAAGGYRFLHIGLEMAPPDDVLAWASSVITAHPGLPVIVTTHDHLNTDGSRTPNPAVDMKAVDPIHNNPEDVWTKFLSKHPQIFLVLSGHEHAQALRIDRNEAGGKVYQIMADYQARAQVAKDAGIKVDASVGVGDGWLRLMTFDLATATPSVRVRTYSTHYKAYSTDLPDYAAWYKAHEKPTLTDAQFLGEDDFSLTLDDFRARFGPPRPNLDPPSPGG
jgi:hypothetical protein